MVRPVVPRVRSSSKVTSRIASRAAALRRRPVCCRTVRGRADPSPACTIPVGSGVAGADVAWSSPVPALLRASLALDETKGPDKESWGDSARGEPDRRRGRRVIPGTAPAGLSGWRRRLLVRGYLVAG